METLDFFSRLAGHAHPPDKRRGFLSKASLQQQARDKRLAIYPEGMRHKRSLPLPWQKMPV